MKAKPIPTSPKNNPQHSRDESVEAFMRDTDTITKPTVVRFSAGFFFTMVVVSMLAGVVGTIGILFGRDQWPWLARWVGESTQVQPVVRTVTRNVDASGIPTNTIKNVAQNVVSIYVRREAVGNAAPLLDQLYLPSDRRGAGVLLTEDGVGVTTRRAIPDLNKEVAIVTHDQTVYLTKQFFLDPASDLVFFQISARGLPVVDFVHPDSLIVGETVLSMIRQSTTLAPVAGLTTIASLSQQRVDSRSNLLYSSERLPALLQTKAAMEVAGAPVFTTDGKIVCVHTGTDGDCIPVDVLQGGLQRIQKTGGVSRNILGVQYVDLAIAKGLLIKPTAEGTSGALLAGDSTRAAVKSKSPADRAGLRAGDIILKVNDHVLSASYSLADAVQAITARGVANITYLRDGKEQNIPVTLEVTTP